ncbi:histidine kinase [uncultured Aquimarina sp.]|uniref:sensor histidine kinase n=1 Tax=uncultured Aquimarina sp. TaxID=575652 RepID=UPI0026298F82|nr:histidine kinase [uncultured Aquimarina sp.]
MKRTLLHRSFAGIRVVEFIAFIGFYLFFASAYHIALWINRGAYNGESGTLFDPRSFMDDSGLGYSLKLLITLPIWWLLFRKLKAWPMKKRVLLHIILLPAFVLIWKQGYYLFSEFFGFFYLKGVVQIWDIYLPALFYVLQFGILHSYQYHIDNQKKIKVEGELRSAALKSELSALKAQLNPHFLYNVFNTISASVPPGNEKTRHMIAELSDLFRYQLQASKVEKVPLQEELSFVKKYLALEKERFQERLQVNIEVAQEVMNEMIPPMLLQPLVENSVKHGLASLINGGTISITIQKRENGLFFEVADTGVGIEDKEAIFGKGIGLTNTKMRLEKMYQTTLHLTENIPQGLKINFTI